MVSVIRMASLCTAGGATAVVVRAGAANPHSGVREAGSGKADLTTARAITSKTVFDMVSNSRQFTADAVLLLAGRHRLALNDPLSDNLDNPPVRARDVTLGDLTRHTRFSYSTSNCVLLAHVVERVTGKPFPTFIQQEFFTPLDVRMTSSPAVDVSGRAKSYDEKGDGMSPDRNTAVTVVCNADPPDNFRAANQLLDIWTK